MMEYLNGLIFYLERDMGISFLMEKFDNQNMDHA